MSIRRKSAQEGLVPMQSIRRIARDIGAKFRPEQVILFGSYAYGQPDAESDVDLLVVMRTEDEVAQAVRICAETDHPFAMDVLVRTPNTLRRRLREGDWFLREVISRGKILHERPSPRMGTQGRSGPQSRGKAGRRPARTA